MAPILSLLAEQITDHYQKNKTESVHLQLFTTDYLHTVPLDLFHAVGTKIVDKTVFFEQYEELWMQLKKMRSTILKAIEPLREQGIIKHSLEAKVMLVFNQKSNFFLLFKQLIANTQALMEAFIAEFTIVSQVQILTQEQGDNTLKEEYIITVAHADGTKCPRCWQWQISNHEDKLCPRCQTIVI
jgi:isoleucyl-tRNA synthetase